MLREYFLTVDSKRRSHPIAQGDFNAWKENVITKQFMEDMEYLAYASAESMAATDSGAASMAAAKLTGIQDCVESAISWMPEYLDKEGE